MSRSVFSLSLAVCTYVLVCCPQISAAQQASVRPGRYEAEAVQSGNTAQPALVTRFYDISPLIDSVPQFPYTGELPATSRSGGLGNRGFSSGLQGGFGAGPGAGGVGMGMDLSGSGGQGAGGGGFFSVPATPVQFGDGGLGGGGMDLGTQPQSVMDEMHENGESLSQLLVEFVEPDSWEENGGRGRMRQLGRSLLVVQSEEVHQRVAAFLRDLISNIPGNRSYTLEVWWLPLNAEERSALEQGMQQATTPEAQREMLRELSTKTKGFHGRMECADRITAHFASGNRKPVVVGKIPVVGSGVSGDNPVVSALLIGLMLEVYVDPVPRFPAGADQSAEQAMIRFRSTLTRDDSEPVVAHILGVDRFQMGTHVVEGITPVRLGQPAVVGSLTSIAIPPAEGNDLNEIVMIMRLTRSASSDR